MIESILILLLYALLLAAAIKIALLVLGRIGFTLGTQIENLIWAAFAIIVLIWVFRILLVGGGLPSPLH